VSEAFFDPNDTRPLTCVAVVVLERVTADRETEVLFAQRPQGKAYAGYWEFPGGKIEANETLEQAAQREIEEELGVHIRALKRWHMQRFSYPHAHVELQFCRTREWSGTPHGREQQAFAWQRLDAITVSPLLPALRDSDDEVLRVLRAAIAEEMPR
jgi:8-oxo-dGTP diphosphatase